MGVVAEERTTTVERGPTHMLPGSSQRADWVFSLDEILQLDEAAVCLVADDDGSTKLAHPFLEGL